MTPLKKALLKVVSWTIIRFAIVIFLFLETIKLIEIIGGIIAFFLYIFILEYVFEKTKPIDLYLAEDLKKVKAKGKGKMGKTFGKKGEQFWDGFNSPMKIINQDEVKKK